MHRLIVALLASVDAAIAVAVGVAAALAPLTLLWVFGLGVEADWGALWPSGATVWLFGDLVPLSMTLPGDYLAAAGIDAAASSFVLSLAPLAFAGFTIIFAARSGVRASRADAWITGVVIGAFVFTGLTAGVALTSRNDLAAVQLWQAILFPSLLFVVPALCGAIVAEWSEAETGAIARLRDRIETAADGWSEVPALAARGTAVVVVGLLGLGALGTAVAIFARFGDIVALYETAHLDVVGVIVVTLGQLAYLPTLVVWAVSYLAGPGFSLGPGATISPAGTQVGVVPGVPVLGALPQLDSTWMLLLALLPVALGAFAGWIARSRLSGAGAGPVVAPVPESVAPATSSTDPTRASALAGMLASSEADRAARADVDEPLDDRERWHDPIGARLTLTLLIAAGAAGAAALLAVMASGSIGPGSLSQVGPEPGPLALAVGVEVVVGAGILLLSPRSRGDRGRRGGGSPRRVPAAADADQEREGAPVD